jgi:hypothetical protein
MSVREELKEVTVKKYELIYRCDNCHKDIINDRVYIYSKVTEFYARSNHLCGKCNNEIFDKIFPTKE